MPLQSEHALYNISDAARVLGISERSLGEMVVNGEVEVKRVGPRAGTKYNMIPVGEIPRIRSQIRDQQQAAKTRRVAEDIAKDREEARMRHSQLQRDADALAERYGFED